MLRIKDWSSYQSYKDRSPPWIRLHKKLLDNYEFQSMSVEARALLPMLWLLASEDEDPVSGLLRDSYEKIAFRLRQPKKDVESAIKEIISAGFLEQIDQCEEQVTEPLRNDHETVPPETETETEINKKPPARFESLSLDDIADWLAKKRSEGKYINIDEGRLLEKFKDYCRSKGPKYKDYAAAFRNSFEWQNAPTKGNGNEKTNRSNYGSNGKSRRAREVLDAAFTESLERDGQENPERLALPEL